MSEYTPEQRIVADWVDDPATSPSADEVAQRFRDAGIRSNGHASRVMKKVKEDRDKKK